MTQGGFHVASFSNQVKKEATPKKLICSVEIWQNQISAHTRDHDMVVFFWYCSCLGEQYLIVRALMLALYVLRQKNQLWLKRFRHVLPYWVFHERAVLPFLVRQGLFVLRFVHTCFEYWCVLWIVACIDLGVLLLYCCHFGFLTLLISDSWNSKHKAALLFLGILHPWPRK